MVIFALRRRDAVAEARTTEMEATETTALEASETTALFSAGIDECAMLSLLRTLLPGAGADEAAVEEAGCTIWDMAADPTAAAFMHQHSLIPLLLHRLSHPQQTSARLLEISAGAAANLCTVDANAREDLLRRSSEAGPVLHTLLLTTDDSSTIFELLRLLSALAHHAAASAADVSDDASEI